MAMGAAGRARVIERHDVAKEAEKLKGLFDRGGIGEGSRERLPRLDQVV